jgi:hypothetical protein
VRYSGASSDCAFAESQLFAVCFLLVSRFVGFVVLFCFVGGGLLPLPEGAGCRI